MRILVIGAGLMARGLLHDVCAHDVVDHIIVADRSSDAIEALRAHHADQRIEWTVCDATDESSMRLLFERVDGVISAAHYGLNLSLTKLAIDTGCHMVDLGGNNAVVTAQLALDDQARAAGVSIVPDCGLAPGLASLLVAWGARHLPWATGAHIRVGGLPQVPVEPLRYERLFNVQGLINEYVEVPIALKDGVITELVPLGDLEHIDLPSPIGTLEAFNTSGGVSTLPQTFADRFADIDYKTFRYPGHAHAMHWLNELGLLSWEPIDLDGVQISPRALLSRQIEQHVPMCDRDTTVVVVRFTGAHDRVHELRIIDHFDEETGLTAMMRTTAFPAAIVSQMQCSGRVSELGVIPQERAIDCDIFLDELESRAITIHGRIGGNVEATVGHE